MYQKIDLFIEALAVIGVTVLLSGLLFSIFRF